MARAEGTLWCSQHVFQSVWLKVDIERDAGSERIEESDGEQVRLRGGVRMPKTKLQTFDGTVSEYMQRKREVMATAVLLDIGYAQLTTWGPKGDPGTHDLVAHLEVAAGVCSGDWMKTVHVAG